MYGGWYGSYKKKKTKSIAQMKAELIAKGAPIPAKTAHRRAFWEPLYNMYVVNANQAHSSHPKAPIPVTSLNCFIILKEKEISSVTMFCDTYSTGNFIGNIHRNGCPESPQAVQVLVLPEEFWYVP